ncbi:MAG: hypothetical protein BTN85_0783 [Candidatus Methanohalarchaeum thermophilum]|uniref:Uncharacterized protein n=1 Tax=Methanohalarchaeum thermophilum TaxID=1903181 RepID=A0A1Q6DVB4_METT1|nr:MAG: hypothetical protein BTN85_0783 [Candidatus Methanohalarchaeum thermophilum]
MKTNFDLRVLIIILVFVTPAILKAFKFEFFILNLVFSIFAIIFPILYLLKICFLGKKRKNETSKGSNKFSFHKPNLSTINNDVLLADYQKISEQAKYRDHLLLKTVYFSLTAFAVLINIFFRVDPNFRLGISAIGVLIFWAFTIASASYKHTRDACWESLREIEKENPEFQGGLSLWSIRKEVKRSFLAKFSLSSYVSTLQVLFVVFWWFMYIYLVLLSDFIPN